MRFVITGATSFIGLEFVRFVLECGHSVFAVCRKGSKSLDKLPKGSALTLVFAALDEYKDLSSKIGQADVFVHFAWGGTTVEERSMVDIQQKNVSYTIDALRAAHQMKCRLFVESGSQAEYGIVDDVITEETPCRPFSEYGKAKLAVKDAGFQLSEELGIKYLHLRIFSVFGENDHPHTLFRNAIERMLQNEPLELSSCTQKWNFLYVGDAARQIYFLCGKAYADESFQHEVFNIASDDTRVLKEFVERIKELLHSQSQLHYGALSPKYVVTLAPAISKMKNYTGYENLFAFDDVVRLTVEKKQ